MWGIINKKNYNKQNSNLNISSITWCRVQINKTFHHSHCSLSNKPLTWRCVMKWQAKIANNLLLLLLAMVDVVGSQSFRWLRIGVDIFNTPSTRICLALVKILPTSFSIQSAARIQFVFWFLQQSICLLFLLLFLLEWTFATCLHLKGFWLFTGKSIHMKTLKY